MNFFAAFGVALRALLVHKGRSALTSLGIVIGIGAVIAMVSAGEGARHLLDERLGSIGKNLILVKAGGRSQHGTVSDFRPLSNADAAALSTQLRNLLVGATPSQSTHRLVSSYTGTWATAIIGVTPILPKIRDWKVARGRFVNPDDMDKDAAVCLLGQTVRAKLFGASADPVGQTIRVGPLPLIVVGVLEAKGRMPTGVDQDDQIQLPITTLQHRLVGNARVSLIVAAARSPDVIDRAIREITRILRERHHLRPGQPDDFDVSSVQEMLDLARVTSQILQMLIAVIASVSLVVGGIGIMNIMLVSVTERTREIGIRLAVGATGFDVLLQFLIEAVALALVGGVLGVTLGLSAAAVLAHLANWPLIVDPGTVLLAFAVSAAVGVFFGYYPALKASRLDPIEALRYE